MEALSFISLIQFLIVLGIVVTLFVLYPKYYRKKVNNSLKNNKPVKAIEPTVLYGGILLAIIIIFNIIIVSSNRSFEAQVNRLQSNVRNLETNNQFLINQVLDLSQDVSDVMSKGDFVQYIEVEVIEEDSSIDGNYIVKLSFYISDNVIDEDLYLYVEEGSNLESFDLLETQARHDVELSLDLHEDYTIYVKDIASVDGIKYDLFDLNLYNYLFERFDIQYDLEYIDNEPHISVFVSNYWENPSNDVPYGLMQVDTIQLIIGDGSGNIILDEFLYTNVRSSNIQYYNYYKNLGEYYDSLMFRVIITDNAGIVYGN